ncbi:MAG TPA: nitroreductase family protein [Rhodospirillales bacterium]|jgi:nitroreductase|nr:nitroreductase family protein [Rhodospirillales bacterium]
MASTELYDALIEICRDRRTSREFDPDIEVPREHFDMILEAARHAPSGANTQPWHYVVVSEPEAKAAMADYFIAEASRRAKLGMKFPTPNYRGLATAPGVIVVVADFRWINAFPVLNDGSELDALYKQNAERILLQSVAVSTMSAHLAAAALGYGVWWVTAIGQENAQSELKPLFGVPEDLAIIDILVFGKPLKAPYKRWKKAMHEIRSFETYNADLFMDQKAIETWIKETRHKVMFRDESRID